MYWTLYDVFIEPVALFIELVAVISKQNPSLLLIYKTGSSNIWIAPLFKMPIYDDLQCHFSYPANSAYPANFSNSLANSGRIIEDLLYLQNSAFLYEMHATLKF